MAYKNAMNKTGIYQDRENGMLKNHGMLKDLGMMQEEGMRGMRKMRGLHQTGELEVKPPKGYTGKAVIAGADDDASKKGRIVTGKKDGKPVTFEVKAGSVFKGGQYVGTEEEVMASLDKPPA